MTFLYDNTLITDLGRLRFEIGDIVSGAGVLPDSTNIPDETLNAILAQEGSVGLAAARICESMARHWARMAEGVTVGARSETNKQAAAWRQMGLDLREQYGGGGTQAGLFSVGMKREDGYAEWNPVDMGVESEYGERVIFIQL